MKHDFGRYIKATKRFFELHGYEVLKTFNSKKDYVNVIAEKDETIVFVHIKEGFEEDDLDRSRFEQIATDYLANEEVKGEYAIRFDCVSLRNLGNGRALIRHHIDCFS